VADIRLTAAPLSGGGDIDIAGNRIIARDDLALVSVATPLQGDAALKKVLTAEFGLKMPSATLSSMAKGVRAVSMAPDAMLLIFAHPTPDAEMHVRDKAGRGWLYDRSDGFNAGNRGVRARHNGSHGTDLSAGFASRQLWQERLWTYGHGAYGRDHYRAWRCAFSAFDSQFICQIFSARARNILSQRHWLTRLLDTPAEYLL
jgi:hypothetical protein